MENQKTRPCYLYIVVGKKFGGKTHLTNKKIQEYNKNGKRVLIFDVNNEYTQYPTIAMNNIERFSAHPKKEIRRIVPPAKKSLDDIADMLLQILESYRVGLLLIEDINKYVNDSLPADLVGRIITLRHQGVDIVIHYQNIGRAGHPKILGNINMLRIHETTDDIKRHKNKFEDRYEIVKISQLIVRQDYDLAQTEPTNPTLLGTWVNMGGGEKDYKSAVVYVNFDKSKIKGNFTEKHFMDAVNLYINMNKDVLLPYSSMTDEDEKLLYTPKEAKQKCKQSLFLKYYGN